MNVVLTTDLTKKDKRVGTFLQKGNPTSGAAYVEMIAGDGSGVAVPPNSVSTTVYASSLVVKDTPGTLLGFSGYNSGSTPEFIQVHNKTALPANGTIPVITFQVPAYSPFSMSFGSRGRAFSVGIVLATSTTGPTLTLATESTWFDAQVL